MGQLSSRLGSWKTGRWRTRAGARYGALEGIQQLLGTALAFAALARHQRLAMRKLAEHSCVRLGQRQRKSAKSACICADAENKFCARACEFKGVSVNVTSACATAYARSVKVMRLPHNMGTCVAPQSLYIWLHMPPATGSPDGPSNRRNEAASSIYQSQAAASSHHLSPGGTCACLLWWGPFPAGRACPRDATCNWGSCGHFPSFAHSRASWKISKC